MTLSVIQLPLDPSGTSLNNRVVNEPHALTANRTFRAIALNNGVFFNESVVVVDAANGHTLTDGSNGTAEQYYITEPCVVPQQKYGKALSGIIIIKDPTVSNNVLVTAQMLGGPWTINAQAIIDQIAALGLDDRPVSWGDILGKPDEFNPAHHLHDVGDVYGFEYWVDALYKIRDAILIGDDAAHDAIYRYIDAAIASLQDIANQIRADLDAHVSNFDNPHRVTPAQLSVYTIAQVDALLAVITTALNLHLSDTNNPHQTTAAQVGAYTKAESDARLAAGLDSVRLGFTPVQQSGGPRQAGNKVYIGATSTSVLGASIDGTDIGDFVMTPGYNATIAGINNAIAGKAPAGAPYAYTGQNQNVSFYEIRANSAIYSAGDIWAFSSDRRLKQGLRKEMNVMRKLRMLDAWWYHFTDQAKELGGDSFDPKRKQYGWMAQDFQRVFPEYTARAPFDIDPATGGSKSGMDYITIQPEKAVPLINEGVKLLDRRIEVLTKALERAGVLSPHELEQLLED